MRLTPEQIEETRLAASLHKHPDGRPNAEQMARAMGLAPSTVKNRLRYIQTIEAPTEYEKIHGRRDTPAAQAAPAGFVMPEGHKLKGVSALVDKDGNEVLRWVKTREDHTVADIVESIHEAFKDYEGRRSLFRSPPSRTLTL